MATLEIDIEDNLPQSTTALSIDEREQLYRDAARSLHLNWRYFTTFMKLEEELARDDVNRAKPELLALKFHKLFKFVRGAVHKVAPISSSTAATSTGPQIVRGVANAQRVSEDVRLELFMRNFMPGHSSTIRGSNEFVAVGTTVDIVDAHGNKYRQPGRYEFSALDLTMTRPQPTALANKFLATWRTGHYGAEYLANQIMWPTEYAFFTNNLAELDAKTHDMAAELPTLRVNITNKSADSVAGAVDAVTDLMEYAHGRHNAFYWAKFMVMIGEAAANLDFDSAKYSTLFNILRESLAQTFNISPESDIVNVPVAALPAAWRPVAKALGPDGEEAARAGTIGLLFGARQAHMATDWLFATYLAFTDTKAAALDPIIKHITAELAAAHKQRELTVIAHKKSQKIRLERKDANIAEQKLRFHYINKFGWDTYVKLPGAPRTTSEDTSSWRLFEHIPAAEQKLINLLIKRELELEDNDSAPWRKLVQELRNERDKNKRIAIFNKIKPYIDAGQKKTFAFDWLRTADGHIIMCPHVRDEIELDIKGHNTEAELHEHLLKYAGNTPLQDAYYCSICGEAMTYNEALTGVTTEESAGSDAAEGLRDFIWKQASYLVKSQLEFKMSSPEFINKFVGTVVSALFDTVALAERKLRRIKTNTMDDTDNQLKFYTALYVWAFMLKTVADNHTLVHFVPAIMGRNDRAGGAEDIVDYEDCDDDVAEDHEMNNYYVNLGDNDDYFARIIGHDESTVSGGEFVPKTAADLMPLVIKAFMSVHNVLLQKMRDMNEQFVRDQMQVAFRLVTNLTTRADMKPMPPIDRSTIEKIDPLYIYLRANVPVPGPGMNREAVLFQEYAVLSHKLMHKYEEVGAGRQPVFSVSWTFHETTATATVTAGEFWRKWHTDPQVVRMRGLEAHFSPYMRKIRHYFISPQPFRASNRYNDRPYPHWLMARTYGNTPKFHKHKWNKYVYVRDTIYRGDGKTLYTAAELVDVPRMEPGLVVVDRICAVCNALHSDMTKSNSITEKAGDWLENEETLVSFFNYYMQRCPELPPTEEAPFHAWDPDKCIKCGATKPTLLDRDLTYFNKYKQTFDKILADEAKQVAAMKAETGPEIPLTSAVAVNWQDTITFKPPAGTWLQEITKLAAMAAPSMKAQDYRNLWVNMGLTEGLEYDDIKSGKLNPSADDKLNTCDLRIRKLISYIDELNFDINTIVNSKQMAEVHHDLMHCITAIKKTESLSQFVSISADIDKIIDQYGRGELFDNPLDKLIQFLIKTHQIFVSAAGNNDEGSQLFLRYFTRKLFNSEELAGKMRERKQAAVEASATPDMRYDPNMQDHTESHSFDGLAQYTDKYSYEHMDYNGHNE